MARPFETYTMVEVESYMPAKTGGLHGKVHIRPCPGQGYPAEMHVECARKLRTDYPGGTHFRLKAKLTDREGTGDFLYSNFNWDFDVLT